MAGRISELTGAGAVADANELEINEAGTSKKVTALQIKTHGNTAPVFAAGTASANTWPKFTSGTLLTTAEDGALEHDANAFYLTHDAGNRAYVPATHYIRADSTRTLPNDTALNPIFNSPTNGRLTLETGLYFFEGLLYFTVMHATSGNALINMRGAGTATCAAWLWHAVGIDASAPTTAIAHTGMFAITEASPASVLLAGTGTAMALSMKGTFEVTSAGTLIPSYDAVTAAATVVAIGSYITINRAGSTTAVSVGQWD